MLNRVVFLGSYRLIATVLNWVVKKVNHAQSGFSSNYILIFFLLLFFDPILILVLILSSSSKIALLLKQTTVNYVR